MKNLGKKHQEVSLDLENTTLGEAMDAILEDKPTIIGVALEDSSEEDDAAVVARIALTADRTIELPIDRTMAFSAARQYTGSIFAPHISFARGYASMAYGGALSDITGQCATPGRYQYTEKFPQEVRDKAWKLVEQHMNPDQYFAFMEGTDIELENRMQDFRLIINKIGNFTILQGARGSGIVAQAGRVRSYDYPLGDEISAFIDWFNHKTKELIAQWACGTYGIVKDDLRR